MTKAAAASRPALPGTPRRDGLILFAHGSRNPAWRKPFDRILREVRKASAGPAALAFGEFMAPDLATAARNLAAQGVTHAVVVPLFLGGGAHVRGDTPRLAREAAAAADMRLRVARAAGEDAGVLRAMALYCLGCLSQLTKTPAPRRSPKPRAAKNKTR